MKNGQIPFSKHDLSILTWRWYDIFHRISRMIYIYNIHTYSAIDCNFSKNIPSGYLT